MKRTQRASRTGRRPLLGFEQLEPRRLLSASNPWHNHEIAVDVNGDGEIAAVDALQIINELNTTGSRLLLVAEGETQVLAERFLDVNNDGSVSPIDALGVIDELNQLDPEVEEILASSLPTTESVFCGEVLSAADVEALLRRASAASTDLDAIIAVVDRGGAILGVRTQQLVVAAFDTDSSGTIDPGSETELLVFAVDGAVAKARTAAFFAHNMAPLTSRTIRMISQSTIVQREVESNPNETVDQLIRGPGTVAPIGLGAHFPPAVRNTPPVDLFDIEHTNRDSLLHPGLDGIKGTNPLTGLNDDPAPLAYRFGIDPADVPAGQEIQPPESYGLQSGLLPLAQARGIGTLPGGIPLYKNGCQVGGIGVFFPGPDGFATHEQGFSGVYPSDGAGPVGAAGRDAALSAEVARTNADKVLDAEWIAFAAAGGSSGAGASQAIVGGVPLAGFDLPFGRIDLVGITLEVFGPNPTSARRQTGVTTLLQVGAGLGEVAPNGVDHPIDALGSLYQGGSIVPAGWLAGPRGSTIGGPSQADVINTIGQAYDSANLVRAGIRLPLGTRSRMVFAVADQDGSILGLYRMQDATYFSIGVAVAKARNMAYYASAGIQPADQVVNVPVGTAFTNRTFRFLVEPRFPEGIDGAPPAAFSILNHPDINNLTAENSVAISAVDFSAGGVGDNVLGFTRFNAERNFHAQDGDFPIELQSGVVFFPGAAPLYDGALLLGGLGVSGDGVDQDDVVTSAGTVGFKPLGEIRVDRFFVGGVRLPYQKFLRNPHGS